MSKGDQWRSNWEETFLLAEWNELGAALSQECKKLARNPKEDKGVGLTFVIMIVNILCKKR